MSCTALPNSMTRKRAISQYGYRNSNRTLRLRGHRKACKCCLRCGVIVMSKTPEEIADECMAKARKAGFRPKAKDAERASAGGKSWKDGIITAEELQTKQFKPVRIILPNLIPEGVTILAGKPKIGKSWLLLDICLAIAGDRFVLGEIKGGQGDVLYLALEDNERRLKKRVDKILQSAAAPE